MYLFYYCSSDNICYHILKQCIVFVICVRLIKFAITLVIGLYYYELAYEKKDLG